jgi:geranylgeranyl reductase family protein
LSRAGDHAGAIVVGAGPAGSAAAAKLARAGVDCVLVDKATFPRDKCCGDGLTTAALRELDALGFDPVAVPSFTPLDRLSFRAPSGRVARVPLPRRPGVFGAVARRAELDAALVATARAAGARTVLGQAVRSVAAAEGGVALELDDGTVLQARTVVVADGAWSPLRRLLGGAAPLGADRPSPEPQAGEAPPAGPDWIAFRAYARNVSAEAARELWICFEPDLLPGYAWSFPLAGGTANVGVYLRRDRSTRGRDLAAAWERALGRPFLASLLGPAAELEPAKAWPIPATISPVRLTALGGRVLFAGDAAGAADPFTGEGIAQALRSGALAAAAIVAGGGSAGVAARYVASMTAELGRDQTVARWCSALMSRPLGARAAVALTGATSFTRASSARWLFEDYPRGLPLRPRAWGELARRRPGLLTAGGSPRAGAPGR